MSALVIVGQDLRDRVAQALREQAREWPNSSAASRIKPEAFDQVVLEIARLVDVKHPDFDVTLTANLGRVLHAMPQWFERPRQPSRTLHFTRFWNKRHA